MEVELVALAEIQGFPPNEGEELSKPVPVVKVQGGETANRFPARSFTSVVMVILKIVPAAKGGVAGVKTTTLLSESRGLHVPGSVAPPPAPAVLTIKVSEEMVCP